MKLCEKGHFLTLAQGHLHMKIRTGFSQKPVGHFESNFICKLLGPRKLKYNGMSDAGHFTKMAAMPVYVKSLQNSSPEPLD